MGYLVKCAIFATIVFSVSSLDIVGTCDNNQCQDGEHCVLVRVQCFRAPCYPVEQCIPATPVEKPGSCPNDPPGHVGICAVFCQGDESCPGDQKCCGSCPKRCKTPVPDPAIERPGYCPTEQAGQVGICAVFCFGDASCPEGQKCCGNCPRECKPAVDEKPGRCPPRPYGFFGGWCKQYHNECSDDSDCEGDHKCCNANGCRLSCVPPYGDQQIAY